MTTIKAENTPTDYVPDIDTILEEKKGICFELCLSEWPHCCAPSPFRQNWKSVIPVRPIMPGSAFTSRNPDGWTIIIEFDGKDWVLMDPTLAANNSSKAVAKYIGDGSKYTVKYSY